MSDDEADAVPSATEQKIVCDALRELLEQFRLPGESQQINRITETFAEIYFATNPRALRFPSCGVSAESGADPCFLSTAEIKSQDAVYVLAYSVIMLNVDQHSAQIRKRMDIEAYSRNLRGVNDGVDFAPEYLVSRAATYRLHTETDSRLTCRRNPSTTRSASARSSYPRSTRTRLGSNGAGRSY